MFLSCQIFAHENSDSVKIFEEIIIDVYPDKKPLFRSPAAVSLLDKKQLEQFPGNSLVSSLYSLPGVRMEERSPLCGNIVCSGGFTFIRPGGIDHVCLCQRRYSVLHDQKLCSYLVCAYAESMEICYRKAFHPHPMDVYMLVAWLGWVPNLIIAEMFFARKQIINMKSLRGPLQDLLQSEIFPQVKV